MYKRTEPDVRQHEQTKRVQHTFRKQVQALCTTIEDFGNPVTQNSADLIVLDTREIVDSRIAETVRKI